MPSAGPARAARADTVRATRRRGAAPTAAASNSLGPEGGTKGDASLRNAGNPATVAEAATPPWMPAEGSCQVSRPATPTPSARFPGTNRLAPCRRRLLEPDPEVPFPCGALKYPRASRPARGQMN